MIRKFHKSIFKKKNSIMKKTITIFSFLCFLDLVTAQAQTPIPFNTLEHVDINNISAGLLVHGDMWWNPVTQIADCSFPATSVKNISFAGSLWMSGYDTTGNLHLSAQTYRQNGNDYWPGPLNSSDTLTYASSQKWAKIWKINRTDIQHFQGIVTHDSASTLNAIWTWPAKGNIHAAGLFGAPLDITTDMAPFVDLNGNGIYEPLLGEYPDIKGDQALWWVYSDNGAAHSETNAKPLDVEIHGMAFAYHRGTLIDNVIYYDYNVINKSPNTYTNFRIGQWADMDLGYYLDDFIGFDSIHRMGFNYNGTNDDGLTGGHPPNSYATHMPIAGVTLIVMPGDSVSRIIPAGSFTYYNNDTVSDIGNPVIDTQFNNYLRSKLKNGQHFTKDFAGSGVPCRGYGSGPNTNYVFNGKIGDTSQWTECNCNNTPGDRRYIIASNDFTFHAGEKQHIVMALVTTNLDSNNGCPALVNFDSIYTVADTAWATYFNPLPPLPSQVQKLETNGTISIYPNPAHNFIYIIDKNKNLSQRMFSVYNTIGQKMNVESSQNLNTVEIKIENLPNGIYYLLYNNGIEHKNTAFIKNN